MRAVTSTPEHRLTVSDLDEPELIDGEVVVKIEACGICGSDLHLMESKLLPPGVVMGHEAAGVIESVGGGVSSVAPGDHVAIIPFDACGECDNCKVGDSQRCMQNAATSIGLGVRPGAYAEKIALREGMVVPFPADRPLELAALAEPLAVALHGLRRSRFEPGMTVGVIGCGPIGLCSILVAQASGAGSVWASDLNEFRVGLADQVGAEAGKNPRDADIVVECAGAQGTIDLAVSSTRGGGQVVLLAVNVKGDTVFPFTWVTREIDIVPCLGYSREEYVEAAGWIADGTVDVTPLITRRVSLDETDEAFFALLEGTDDAKVLVKP